MKEYGLVFCGGGGRGAYQIGVWKALAELGIASQVKAVSGTSVGALNAALFASKSPDVAEKIWTSLKQEDITDPRELAESIKKIASGAVADAALSALVPAYYLTILPRTAFTASRIASIKKEGLFSQDGLKRIIKSNYVEVGVRKSSTLCFACRIKHDSTTREREYVLLNEMKGENEIVEALSDSSCIPFFFREQERGGMRYEDGGWIGGDNCPIEPLYNPISYNGRYYNLNLRKIIVVMLKPDEKIDISRYPDAEFIEIRPNKSIFLGHTGINIFDDGMTDFEGQNARTRIDLGYNDTIEVFKKIGITPRKKALNTSRRTAIERIIYKYKEEIGNNYEFTCGNTLDSDKVSAAISHYARDVSPEDVIAIFDDTIKGTGKSGFLLTKDAFIVSIFRANQKIPYSSIAAIEIKKGGDLVIYKKEGGKSSFYFSGCNTEQLKELLDEIRRLF